MQELRRIGISPQILVARCEKSLDKELKRKLAMSCDVDDDSVIVAEDTESIYKCPLNFLEEGILTPIARYLGLEPLEPKMDNWDMLVKKIIVPKSLIHAGANTDTRVNIKWIDSEELEEDITLLYDVDSILIPGGFGERGIKGKLEAIKYARENNIPMLGICLGMQLSLIEFARNVVSLKKDTKTYKAYNEQVCVRERHRHRYEANPKYRELFEKNGMIISGESNGLIESIELINHPWFVAVQFHPEFTSRLQRPNPVILEFVKQTLAHKKA